MRWEFSAPTGRAKTAQCNALGSSWNFSQALKGRHNAMLYSALSGLSGRGGILPGALRLAFTFRPVGAGEVECEF